jgi:hypothetical protein
MMRLDGNVYNADIHAEDLDGRTPLYSASEGR